MRPPDASFRNSPRDVFPFPVRGNLRLLELAWVEIAASSPPLAGQAPRNDDDYQLFCLLVWRDLQTGDA